MHVHDCTGVHTCSRVLLYVYMYIYIYIHIAASWGSVVNDLKTHPHCEDAFVKQRPRRRISRRRRILKTHWVKTHWKAQTHWQAQTHCEDALGGADAL